ncbi:MAG TPA: cytochrome P460 family protein [Steroidobacteraceae bacterium]
MSALTHLFPGLLLIAGTALAVMPLAAAPGRWGYFDFGKDAASARIQPGKNCFECHERHAAADMTFVQFYPTLQQAAGAR